jgi:hypothetical protein
MAPGCVLLAALSVASVAHGAPTERKQEEARALYRAGRYVEACPLFEQVTRARPEDGAAWADLGLCELRRGRREASIQASLHAVRVGEEQVRLNAYYNLSLAGHRIPMPTEQHSCQELEAPAALSCAQRARVCAASRPGDDSGNGGGTHYQGVWFTDASNPAPVPDALEVFREDDPEAGTLVDLSAWRWLSTKDCDVNWFFSPPAFERAIARCQRISSVKEDCKRRVQLSLAEGVEAQEPGFPLTDREKKEIREASRQCGQALRERMREGSGTLCHIVSVDPCRRRAGVACDARVEWRIIHRDERPTPPRKRLRVEEAAWGPGAPDTRPGTQAP